MKAKSIVLVSALSALSFGSVGAYAVPATTTTTTTMTSPQLSQQDKMWVKNAHQVNLAEIKEGKMAEQKAKSPKVKKIGKTLVSDHSKLDRKLMSAAKKMNVTLPSSPSMKQQSEAQMLSQKSGSQFDRTFIQDNIKGHKKAIQKTQKEMSQGKSKKVKKLAKKTLPVLKKHLHMVKKAHSKMSSSSMSKMPSRSTM
jgi:putative membrane protein